jgi:hypothetical protein
MASSENAEAYNKYDSLFKKPFTSNLCLDFNEMYHIFSSFHFHITHILIRISKSEVIVFQRRAMKVYTRNGRKVKILLSSDLVAGEWSVSRPDPFHL